MLNGTLSFDFFEIKIAFNQIIKLKIQIFECSKLFRIKNATIKIAKKRETIDEII